MHLLLHGGIPSLALTATPIVTKALNALMHLTAVAVPGRWSGCSDGVGLSVDTPYQLMGLRSVCM